MNYRTLFTLLLIGTYLAASEYLPTCFAIWCCPQRYQHIQQEQAELAQFTRRLQVLPLAMIQDIHREYAENDAIVRDIQCARRCDRCTYFHGPLTAAFGLALVWSHCLHLQFPASQAFENPLITSSIWCCATMSRELCAAYQDREESRTHTRSRQELQLIISELQKRSSAQARLNREMR